MAFSLPMKTADSVVVGVTGGIGSGKSEVCRLFQALGACVISADDLAKRLMETDENLKRTIMRVFGHDAYAANGKLNRAKLAFEIFSDPKKKSTIDSIVHPRVLNALKDEIRRRKKTCQVIVIEAALIYESGAESLLDFIVVVDADRETRIQRVMRRDGISRADVLRRARAQFSQRAKVSRADFVVVNNRDLSFLEETVSFLYKLFLTMAHR